MPMKTMSIEQVGVAAEHRGATVRSASGAAISANLRPFAPADAFKSKQPVEVPPQRIDVKVDASQVDQTAQRQAASVQQLTQLVSSLIAEMRHEREASPAPIKAWDFKVSRDDNDRLTGIRATAIR